jgi:uncharacterized protein (TIGR02302 family)
MSTDPQKILNRKISLARLAIGWERFLEAIFPSVMIAGLVLLAVLTGVAGWLPVWAKLAFAGVAAASLVWSLTRLGRIDWPSRDEAIFRIEQRSGVRHRPATSYADQLADEASATPEQRALWNAHRERMAREMDRLKPGAPRSPLPRIDQNALRNALAVALVAAGVLSAGSWRDRVAEAVSLTPPAPETALSLDAWVNPPSYTAKPPVLLTRPATADQDATGTMAQVSVPQGAELVARLTGSDQLTITLLDPQTAGAEGTPAVLSTIKPEPAEQDAPAKTSQELRTRLERTAIVSINAGGRDMGSWMVTVIPDTPPVVSMPSGIEQTPTGGFAVPWKVSDDYGVAALGGKLALSGEQFEDSHVDPSNPFLDTAPELSLSLKKVNPREAEGKNFHDLTEHPWAGLDVELVLEATDQAGQTGTSEVVKFALPERPFSKPLAKALVEQRRNLFMRPEEERDVVRALLALMIWPDGLIESSGVYLGIRNAASTLYRARTHEDIKQVTDALWQIALTIESGNLPEALKKLQAIKKELEKALAEGAPEEKIAELMQQLREAMNEYLQAMQQQMLEEMRKNPQASQQQQQNQQAQQSIRSQDLQKMMDMIEQLAKSGARDAAQQMLSELENILQNLRPGQPQQANPQRNSPMARMLDQLSEMMRRQQQLMDQTFRMPQNGQQQQGGQQQQQQGQMQPGQEGQEPGQRGQNGQQTPGGGQLSQQQRDLAQMLEKLMEQMRQQGMQPGEGLGRAQQEMGEASGELGQGQRNEALGSQGEAMRGMREGAREMAQQLMQQGTGNEGNIGRHGEGRDADQRDPLGRPMPSQGEEYGQRENMLPSEAAVERARRILDALRSRANEPDRPRLELDYIDRLLKGLY